MIGILILILFELVCNGINFLFSPKIMQNNALSNNLVMDKIIDKSSKLDKKRFCDFIHPKSDGVLLMSSCVTNYFRKNLLYNSETKIVAIGGSTTEGFNCGEKNTWVEEVGKNLKVQVVNLGLSGSDSEGSLLALKKYLQHNSAPTYVLEGDWVNEIIGQDNTNKSVKTILLFRIHRTMYNNLLIFRLISNLITSLTPENLTQIDLYNFFDHHGESAQGYAHTNLLFNSNNNQLIDRAIVKYKKNIKEIAELSSKFKIKLIIVKFPHFKNYYKSFFKKYNDFFEIEWFPKIKYQQQLEAEKYQLNLIDTEKCFDVK